MRVCYSDPRLRDPAQERNRVFKNEFEKYGNACCRSGSSFYHRKKFFRIGNVPRHGAAHGLGVLHREAVKYGAADDAPAAWATRPALILFLMN
jgi:hypothetical protein